MPRTTPAATLESAGIFHREYLLVTLGACALVFLAAFESLAVTTIMPLVSRELDGAALYALAFAGPLATGVIGMVAAGNWSDRRGPVGPLYASVAMFVLGLLVSISQLHRATSFSLLILLGALLLPEVLTAEGIPHALRAIGALPVAIVLAVVGINYLLERWNNTFPINSAARSLGASGVALLLMLSALHGYQSYFVAWAGDPATYKAFSEDMSQLASYVNRNQTQDQRYLVIGGYSNIAVEYLTHNKATYTRLEPSQIAGYNFGEGPKQFLVSTDFKQKALEALAQKFPGGKTSSRYSEVTDEEMFVIYEVK